MENKPTIYILAGANGIGKTSANSFFIPSGVPYINADDIAKQLRERLGQINVQEIANAEAIEQMNAFIAKRQNFAIESNLADKETWLFLIGVQGLGYTLHLNFFGVSDVEICNNRVRYRVLQGGHFVRPDIVQMRYEVGLKLLKHYIDVADYLVLTDNTTEGIICAELVHGKIVREFYRPSWVDYVLSAENSNESVLFSNVADVREKYRKIKGGSD